MTSSRPLRAREAGYEDVMTTCSVLSQVTPTPTSQPSSQPEQRLWILGHATGKRRASLRARQGGTRHSDQAQPRPGKLPPHIPSCAMPRLPPTGSMTRTASSEVCYAFRATDGTQREEAEAGPVAFSMGHRTSNPHEQRQMKVLLVERDVYAAEMNKLWQRLCRAEERVSAERTLRQELARDYCAITLAREAEAEEVRRLRIMQSEMTSRANVYLLFAKRVIKWMTATRSRDDDGLPAQSSFAASSVSDAVPRPTTSPEGVVRRVRHVRVHHPPYPPHAPPGPGGRTESAPAQRPMTGHVRDSDLLHALHAAEDRISYLEAQQRGSRAGGCSGAAGRLCDISPMYSSATGPFTTEPRRSGDAALEEVAGHDTTPTYSPTIPKLTIIPSDDPRR